MKKLILTSLFIVLSILLNAQSGSITNIQIFQRTDGSGLVDVHFDLAGTESSYYISLEVSFDGGQMYSPVPANFISGDVGPINPGNSKLIVWDGSGSYPNTYSTQTKLKIIADNTMNTTDGLLAYYPFNGNAYDESGNGNNGTVEGADLTADRFGNADKAYNFDGVNDRITTTFKPTNINSISVWFNAESSQPFNSGVFSTYQGYNFHGYYLGFQQVSSIGTLYYDGNQGKLINFPGWNEWVHLVVCSNGTAITVYVNGEVYISFAGTTNHAGNLYVGDSKYDSHYFKGKIDDIRIYDFVLTPQEVQNLYNESSR